jgi:hypothetical protein
MKITPTLSFLALLPTIGAQCDFCPSGITGGNDTDVPYTFDFTCEDLATYAMTERENISPGECGQMKTGGHPVCCPADVGPGCDFCPTGVEKEDLEVFEHGIFEGENTCGDLEAT